MCERPPALAVRLRPVVYIQAARGQRKAAALVRSRSSAHPVFTKIQISETEQSFNRSFKASGQTLFTFITDDFNCV